MTVHADQERHTFQAEVVQILDLMINSLYSNKEIFLRELISNASDAIDRLRLELLSQSELPEAEGPLKIRVSYDKDARTITVSDNGIGMSRDEVVQNIGTIAKSGTREFLNALTGDQRKDAALIGQFGVGFYSAFIVADRVRLTTRRLGLPSSDAVVWESDGKGEYTLETADQAERGTSIVLHLREEEDDLLNGFRLRSIIQKFSDHISLPIVMPGEPGPDQQEGEQPGDDTVNQASALWARPKGEISEQDYNEFYKHVAHDFSDPLAYVHSKMEGTYEYTLLLFIPSRAPFDLWAQDSHHGVKLHVRRVFITEDTGQIMPGYLRFVRGVIDSSDLPLNISREMLQSSRAVESIRNSAVKKVLKLLADLADKEPEKYATFWKEFGTALKEGISDDYANRQEIAKLLRFNSTSSAAEEEDVSLADYVSRMKEGQEHIYYLWAPSRAAATSSPHLEIFREKGIEVLLLGHAVDNFVVTSLQDFDGKRLQSVAQGAASLDSIEDEKEREDKEKASTDLAPLIERMKSVLPSDVFDVRVSHRLTTSPACIVANEPEIDLNVMRRLRGTGIPSQPVLEINPTHPLIQQLSTEQDDERFADWSNVLYSEAVLTLGVRIEDPAAFVTRLNSLLAGLAGTGAPEKAAPEKAEEPASNGEPG